MKVRGSFRLTLLAGLAARTFLLAWSLLIIAPVTAVAGPKEDAFQVIEQFKSAFDASDVQRIVKLFAPDASFLGTVSPKLITKTEDVDAYFQAIKTNMPRKITIEEYSTLVLSDTAVVFAGFDVFGMTKDGQAIEAPARFTFVITKAIRVGGSVTSILRSGQNHNKIKRFKAWRALIDNLHVGLWH